MGLIKKLLMLILLLVVIGAGAVWGAKYIPEGQLSGVKHAANQVQPFISANIQHANLGNVGQLTGQLSSNVQSVTGKVLGVQTSNSETQTASDSSHNTASLPQKTFELARYSYCKEVVKEYESRQ
ncbi:hypothetical protein H3C66_00355 [Patescibacteria group bacterium]|nr:hypothetical protein [Patescibacteria group bacterium]